MNKDSLSAAALRAGAAAGTAGFLYWQNYGMQVKRYELSFPALPTAFDGFRIVQISDYHNTPRLEDKIVLAAKLIRPDMTAITGDLFDCRKTDIVRGLSLLERLVKISPVYCVTGNHEAKLPDYTAIRKEMAKAGAVLADGKKFTLKKGREKITLLGIHDPQFWLNLVRKSRKKSTARDITGRVRNLCMRELAGLCGRKDGFRILLSHRPEYIKMYSFAEIDLALTGHAHGGQFGIPFTDTGVYVPNQGFFPAYAAGVKTEGDTVEIISRGLGNSIFPQRLFNRPELVLIELHTALSLTERAKK